MDKIISLVLKEFSDENISIDVLENSVKIVTSSNCITINNRIREPRTGPYRSRRNYTGPVPTNPIQPVSTQNVDTVKDKIVSDPLLPVQKLAGHTIIEEKLSVMPHDPSNNLFRELTNNFIVQQRQPGLVEVVGKLDNESNIVPLTPKESLIAREMGLVLPYS